MFPLARFPSHKWSGLSTKLSSCALLIWNVQCPYLKKNTKLDVSDSKMYGLKKGLLESFAWDLRNETLWVLCDSQGYHSYLLGLICCLI